MSLHTLRVHLFHLFKRCDVSITALPRLATFSICLVLLRLAAGRQEAPARFGPQSFGADAVSFLTNHAVFAKLFDDHIRQQLALEGGGHQAPK